MSELKGLMQYEQADNMDKEAKYLGTMSPVAYPATEISNNKTTSSSLVELATALAKAQGEIESAKKDSTNPHFKSKYADLASVWDAIRGPLSKNGLSVVQMPTAYGSEVCVTTLLLHASGQWIKSTLTMLVGDKATPQAVGSAITYAKRYSLTSMTGVAPDEDDDGNAASGSASTSSQAQRVPSGSWTKKDTK